MPNTNVVTIFFVEVRTELYFTESPEAFSMGSPLSASLASVVIIHVLEETLLVF